MEATYEEAMAVVSEVIKENPFPPKWRHKFKTVQLNNKQFKTISSYFNCELDPNVIIYDTEPKMKIHTSDGTGWYHM